MSNWTQTTCEYGQTVHSFGGYTVHQTEREDEQGRYRFWSVELNGERISEQQRCSEGKTFAELHREGNK